MSLVTDFHPLNIDLVIEINSYSSYPQLPEKVYK